MPPSNTRSDTDGKRLSPRAVQLEPDTAPGDPTQAHGEPAKREKERRLAERDEVARVGDEDEGDDKKLDANQPPALSPIGRLWLIRFNRGGLSLRRFGSEQGAVFVLFLAGHDCLTLWLIRLYSSSCHRRAMKRNNEITPPFLCFLNDCPAGDTRPAQPNGPGAGDNLLPAASWPRLNRGSSRTE